MRPNKAEIYQVDRNPEGEFLVAVPDLGVDEDGATFEVRDGTLLFYFENGDVVKLPSLTRELAMLLADVRTLTLLEVDKDHLPVRCYACEVIS